MLAILQVESMDGFMLYLKVIIFLLVFLLIVVHLFGDLLLSIPMTIILM